jgi:TRAP-type C4-dicarboxylate transport system permease large subunit
MAHRARLREDAQLPDVSARDAEGVLHCAADVDPALMTPFIIVGGILLGWFTATESAAWP